MKKKKGLKKIFSVTVILAMLMTMVPASAFASTITDENVDLEWYNYANNQENNRITDRETPTDSTTAALKWGVKYGTGWGASCTPPLILDGKIYTAQGNKVHELNKDTGEIIRSSDEMIGNVGYAMNPIVYADGMLYVQVANGMIQAIDLENMTCVWHSEKLGGQTVSNISYTKVNGKGYVYTGTWTGENRDGYFFAVSTDNTEGKLDDGSGKGGWTKAVTWKFQPSGSSKDKDPTISYDPVLNATLENEDNVAKRGFYWAGAYACEKYVAVGSDDGTREGDYTANGVFYTLDTKTGKIIDRVDGIKGDIRSSVVYDNGYLFFCTKGGLVCRVAVDSEGHLSGLVTLQLVDNINGGNRMITSTPVVYGNKIYIGASGTGGQFDPDGGHAFAVIDNSKPDSLELIYDIPIPGYPQASPLLSTAYMEEDFDGDKEADNRVYIYFTYNAPPGGIYYIYDTPEATEPLTQGEELFVPESSMQQHCISTIIADREGTLYYKNDSCYLMAVETNMAYITGAEVKADDGSDASWDHAFDQKKTNYALKVSEDARHVTLKLEKPAGTDVTVNGEAYTEGMDVQLNDTGETALEVVAKAGEQSKMYTFTVKRISTDATLKSLQVSESNIQGSEVKDITPEFSPDVTEYTVDTTGITPANNFWRVWPKATDENSTIKVVAGENIDKINDYVGEGKGRQYSAVYPKDSTKTSSCKVVVTSENGKKSTEYTLTFLKRVSVTGISLDRANAALDVTDDPLKLTATIAPEDATDKSVKWYSMNIDDPGEQDESKLPAVVSEDGTVTPQLAGNAKITVITNDGSKTAECDITVTDKGKDAADAAKGLEITSLEDKADIDAVKGIYDKLTDEQKARADELGYQDAIDKAQAAYDKLVEEAEQEEIDKAAAKAVEDKIDAIGSIDGITIESREVIEAARAAYDGLTDKQKEYVSSEKLEKLEQAEEKLAEVVLEKAKEDAKAELNAYKVMDNYRDEQKAELSKIISGACDAIDKAKDTGAVDKIVSDAKADMDKVKTDAELTEEENAAEDAKRVDELITSIGKVEFTAESRAAIRSARAAYDALSDMAKEKVTALSVLETAEAEYEAIVEKEPTSTLNDKTSGIVLSGKFMDDIKLTVNELAEDIQATLKKAFEKDGLKIEKYLGGYDMQLEGGHEGNLKVRFDVGEQYNGRTIVVKQLLSDGTVGTYTVTVKDGKVSVTTDTVSQYMLGLVSDGNGSGQSGNSELPDGNDDQGCAAAGGTDKPISGDTVEASVKTGDTNNIAVWVTLLVACAAAGAIAAAVVRRRKAEK